MVTGWRGREWVAMDKQNETTYARIWISTWSDGYFSVLIYFANERERKKNNNKNKRRIIERKDCNCFWWTNTILSVEKIMWWEKGDGIVTLSSWYSRETSIFPFFFTKTQAHCRTYTVLHHNDFWLMTLQVVCLRKAKINEETKVKGKKKKYNEWIVRKEDPRPIS